MKSVSLYTSAGGLCADNDVEQGFTDHIPADDNAVLCYSGARGEDKMILIYKKDGW